MQVFDLERWDSFKGRIFYFFEFSFVPYFRRILRFVALPYCYLFLINWNECTKSKVGVIGDLFYIFFVFKYFPDNYSKCRLWEKDRSEWKYYYGSNYEPYQRRNLRVEIQKKEYDIIFNNKYICFRMCKVEGLPLPEQYGYFNNKINLILKIKVLLSANPNEKLILKPVEGRAGKNIKLIWKHNDSFVFRDEHESGNVEDIRLEGVYVLQSYVTQHPDMSSIFDKSVNTVRIVTFLTDNNDVIVVGAFARFGVGNNFVDNTSRGGVGVGIHLDNGVLMDCGYDFNSKAHYEHPNTNVRFYGFQIPKWSEVVDLAIMTQKAFPYFRLLGHDIAITIDGPIIIELNSSYDNVGLESKCGPLLKNKSLLEEYDRNMLLVNNAQKELVNKPLRME